MAQLATGGHPLVSGVLGAQIQGPQRFRCMSPQRPDESAVIVVRDLAGAMVELELFECRKRTVAFFREAQAALLQLVRRRQPVVAGRGLSQERQCHEDGAGNREYRTHDERRRQMRTAPSA